MKRKTIREWFYLIDTGLNDLKEQVCACTEDGLDDVCYDNTVDSLDAEFIRQCADAVTNNITQMLDSLEDR